MVAGLTHSPCLGETDGSSYPNGGLRATHRAGAYLTVDPTSPIFLRGDTIFIPSCLVSYYGHAVAAHIMPCHAIELQLLNMYVCACVVGREDAAAARL